MSNCRYPVTPGTEEDFYHLSADYNHTHLRLDCGCPPPEEDSPIEPLPDVGPDLGLIVRGAKGDPGERGTAGVNGFSPLVTVYTTASGHTVMITDVNGTKTFTVEDGDDYVLTDADKTEIAAQVGIQRITNIELEQMLR